MLRGLPRLNDKVDDPRTRALALLPRAPPMPGVLADLSRSALPALLLVTPPTILYDTVV
jgi:hypothetical protein